ncbi:MAG: (Na+)-NQR maturation NqrM [Succinivibrionaceae bacterium]|nr:(Na+)-NQR maturation NqrM [Ruminobacter sp.]MDY5779824.1 (Na+)-NQR maturation NqrM [Succinivibrionaceae bacterium]MEE1341001.1 (Na+)-NQR maturation NqrM [Succinivibrionaceae bacterium]
MVFVYTLLIFLLFFLLAAIGYIIQHKVIHGSCGGLNNVGVERVCTCEKPCLSRRVKNYFAGKKSEQNNEANGETTQVNK